MAISRFKPGDDPGTHKRKGPHSRRWLKGMVTDALKKKLASMDKASGRIVATMIADRLVRCITNPDPDHDKTVILAWHEIVDRVEGKPAMQVNVDHTYELDVRSDAELKYFLKYGTWPDLDVIEAVPVEVEMALPPGEPQEPSAECQ